MNRQWERRGVIEWNVVALPFRIKFLIVEDDAADCERRGIEIYCEIYSVASLAFGLSHRPLQRVAALSSHRFIRLKE